MASIPGNRPVAFRIPCCDSQNTPSPRFFAEIFDRTTARGNFLAIDSSVFQIFSSRDDALPRSLVIDADGRPRFRKYLPFRSYVNTIENYPYPYVIGHACWEMPCVVPSDWQAQNILKPNNPRTVADMEAAIDATVAKRGVFDLVFHPHGWIRNDQVVALIDHAVARHGAKVKFLSFRGVIDRLRAHLLDGQTLRGDGNLDHRPRLLDVNNDGYLDVVRGDRSGGMVTKIWQPKQATWSHLRQPIRLVKPRFGVLDRSGQAALFTRGGAGGPRLYTFTDGAWGARKMPFADSDKARRWRKVIQSGSPRAIRFRDVDGDATCEWIVTDQSDSVVLHRAKDGHWTPLAFGLPAGTALTTRRGTDAGLRFRDIDGDGRDDVIFSDASRYSVHRFVSLDAGWAQQLMAGRRRDGPGVPAIVRADGTNNGAWFHSRTLWVQNEDTSQLPDLVERLSFDAMLRGGRHAEHQPRPRSDAYRYRGGTDSIARARTDRRATQPAPRRAP